MAQVFLSYARANLGAARRAAEALRSAGYSVWFDADLPAHRSYSEVIEEQLDSASAVLVLWSRQAVTSQWVRSEANRARESGRLVQARLDDSRLPLPFDQIQCAELNGWSGSGSAAPWRKVIDSIAALVGDDPLAHGPAGKSDGIDRRSLVIAGAAAASLGLGALAAWQGVRRPQSNPEGELLLQKGFDALQQNDALDTELAAGAGAQAVALLGKATEALPDSAPAWGGLAMAYAVRKRAAAPSERAGYAERSRAAARQALALDRKDMRALAALALLEPVYRNWGPAEKAARSALRHDPTFPIHIFLLSEVLSNVGRWAEAATISKKANRNRFLIPGADRKMIVTLWGAGEMQGADEALDQAVERWPEHPQVWRTRMFYLMFSGRPADALALIESAERPASIGEDLAEVAGHTARALAGSGSAAAAVAANHAFLRDNAGSALQVVQALALLGETATVFAILEGYYFGDNDWAWLSPPGGDQDRHTSALFLPPMKDLRQLPRFDRLVAKIGLADYWDRSAKMPDYKRKA